MSPDRKSAEFNDYVPESDEVVREYLDESSRFHLSRMNPNKQGEILGCVRDYVQRKRQRTQKRGQSFPDDFKISLI